jgi:hypothetical protein
LWCSRIQESHTFFYHFRTSVSIKALLFLDLMAKPCNGSNLTRNDTSKREAPTRTGFIDFQREAQEALCDIQAALA